MTFKEKVLSLVRDIPQGETRTYKDIAIQAGIPRGARAVARIMKANYDLSIPCHRVIRTDGQIGGYNRGCSEVKRALLEKEGAL